MEETDTIKCNYLSWSQARAMGLTAVLSGKVHDHIEKLNLLYPLPAGKHCKKNLTLKRRGLHTCLFFSSKPQG